MNPSMVNTLPNVTRCPICGAADTGYLRRGYYVKCPECKVAFREQHESVAALDDYWQKEFWTEEEIKKRKDREPVFREAFELLRHQKPQGGAVLDIGCGIGTFLAVCRQEGWDVTGVEPSSIACEVAKREYGLDLINEPFSSAMFQGRKFDAIFAAQVIHHLPDPTAFVADIGRVLADDGILILRTPNLIPLEPSLLLQRFLGRETEFFCGPALYVFHPHTLSLLLRRLGYGEITFVNSRPYLELPVTPWQPNQSVGANLRRLSVTAIKLATYGAVRAVHKLSNGRMVMGPSILVIARKKQQSAGPASGRNEMTQHVGEILRYTCTPRFLVSLIYSFAYYIHEHVVWRAHIHAGRNVRIHATASIRNAQNVYVGENSHINHSCCVWAGETSKIILGDNLLMGPGVSLFAGNHGIIKGQPMTFQERKEESIVIGDDVWLGAHSVITAGTHIANGVIVAAGAVVTRSITEEGVIVGGIPAKVIGQRPSASEPNTNEPRNVEKAPDR